MGRKQDYTTIQLPRDEELDTVLGQAANRAGVSKGVYVRLILRTVHDLPNKEMEFLKTMLVRAEAKSRDHPQKNKTERGRERKTA